jgi:hypothetical protein
MNKTFSYKVERQIESIELEAGYAVFRDQQKIGAVFF